MLAEIRPDAIRALHQDHAGRRPFPSPIHRKAAAYSGGELDAGEARADDDEGVVPAHGRCPPQAGQVFVQGERRRVGVDVERVRLDPRHRQGP